MFYFSNNELKAICKANNFFTLGNKKHYANLFSANSDECNFDDLVNMIWVCSKNVSKRSVMLALQSYCIEQGRL